MSEHIDEHLCVGTTQRTGRGLFTTRAFKRHDKVLELKGELRYFASRSLSDSHRFENWVGIGRDRWIDPAEPYAFLNHSCEPNLGIFGEREFVALREIAANQELTFDYSISEDELPWTMACLCGSPSCRGTIRSIQSLPPRVFRSYLPYVNPHFQLVHLQHHEGIKARA
jgi:uncharacterized protein